MTGNNKKYDLYYCEFLKGKAVPTQKIGGSKWHPMTHEEAITARSKFSKPNNIMLVETQQKESPNDC